MDPVSHSSDMEWHEFSGRATLSTFTCISVAAGLTGGQGLRAQQSLLHRHRYAGRGTANLRAHHGR